MYSDITRFREENLVCIGIILTFLYKMTTSKSCYYIQKKFNNNNNTANTKATWGFPIFRTEKPSFFRAFSEKKKTESHLTSMGE